MSLADAHAFAFSLAATLMVTIIIYRAGDGTMSVMPGMPTPSSARSIRSPEPDGASAPPSAWRHDRISRRPTTLVAALRGDFRLDGGAKNDYYSRSSGRCVRVGGR